jgi:DNA-binding CsgD family transcriptional regulator
MDGGAAQPAMVGREQEADALAKFVAGQGESRAIVLSGDAGMGKTTLWQEALRAARREGVRVLATRASEVELQLPFMALADLLEDVEFAGVSGVPAPQRRALEAALFRTEPEETELSVPVAVGFMAVLRELAAGGRVLVAIDDVPWLDHASAEALTFAARRLAGHDVRFVLARRPGALSALEKAFNPPGAESLEIGPLSLGAVRSLLSRRLALVLPRRVLRRVFDSCGGNPLYALELGRLLLERGTPEIGAELPVPDSIGELFAARISALAGPLQHALLVVAVAGAPTKAQVTDLVDRLVLEDAVSAGLLMVDGDRIRPSHPLLAAAARKHSTAGERREVHLELGRTSPDPATRAQHLALAAPSADARLAGQVAKAAMEAIDRGATHEAVQLAEEALRLTPEDAPERPTRLLDLARYLVIAGELASARALLEGKLEQLPDGASRARAFLILGECAHTVEELNEFADRAIRQSSGDPDVRATALATKAMALAPTTFRDLAGSEALAGEALEVAHAVGGEVERWAACALAWVRLFRGQPVDDLVARFPTPPSGSSLYENAIERVHAMRLLTRGELAAARAEFARLRALADERGEARSGVHMHLELIEVELRAGDFNAAAHLIAELVEWAAFEEIDEIVARYQAYLALAKGDSAAAEGWAAEAADRSQAVGNYREWLEAHRITGAARLLARDVEGAVEEFRLIWDHVEAEGFADPGIFPFIPDFIETLVEAGERKLAEAVVARVDELSRAQSHPRGAIDARRGRAMLRFDAGIETEEAESELLAAATGYAELGLVHDAARTHLALGRALRRLRRWARARAALVRAAEAFERVGADGWANAARSELTRIAGRSKTDGNALTPSERRVAELAAGGLSNKEIAAELVVSVYTVQKHLSHTYAKLGVRSRAQLGSALR